MFAIMLDRFDAANPDMDDNRRNLSLFDADPGVSSEAATEEDFVDVAAADVVKRGTMQGFDVDGERVLVAHTSAGFCAVGGICTHQTAYLEDGVLEEGQVLCPRHGAAFDLKNGAPLTAPADMPVPVYEVRVLGGRLCVSRRPVG